MSKVKYIVAFTDGTCKNGHVNNPGEADATTAIRAKIAATPFLRIPKGFVFEGKSYPLTPAKPKAGGRKPKAAPVAPVAPAAPAAPAAAPKAPSKTSVHKALMAGRSRAAKRYRAHYAAAVAAHKAPASLAAHLHACKVAGLDAIVAAA